MLKHVSCAQDDDELDAATIQDGIYHRVIIQRYVIEGGEVVANGDVTVADTPLAPMPSLMAQAVEQQATKLAASIALNAKADARRHVRNAQRVSDRRKGLFRDVEVMLQIEAEIRDEIHQRMVQRKEELDAADEQRENDIEDTAR